VPLNPVKALMAAMHRPIYESRERALVAAITPHLKSGDRVLDVGCGTGALAGALLAAPGRPDRLAVEGLERRARGGEPVKVHVYDGAKAPFEDKTFDVVIVADVLHHEEHPDRLLAECVRLSRRLVIVKDHQVAGPLAQQRISFIDWAANAPYGVVCLYRYNTAPQWDETVKRHGLTPVEQHRSMNLYPPLVNLVFGRRLHYLGVLRVP
jgi:SAM-dependent methyltransferase